MSTNFTALLDELGTLAKAQAATSTAADEAKALAAAEAATAAAEAAAAPGEGAGEELEEKLEGDEGDATLFKSFNVRLADGTEVPALDATEMMKGMLVQLEERRDEAADLGNALSIAAGVMRGLQATITTQGDLMKSMQAEIGTLRRQGAGRRAVVDMHTKPSTTVAAPPPAAATVSADEVMAKALSLNADKKLTALDVARIQSRLDHNQPLPADLLALLAG